MQARGDGCGRCGCERCRCVRRGGRAVVSDRRATAGPIRDPEGVAARARRVLQAACRKEFSRSQTKRNDDARRGEYRPTPPHEQDRRMGPGDGVNVVSGATPEKPE